MRMRNYSKEVYVLTFRMRVILFKILRCLGFIVCSMFVLISVWMNFLVGVEIRGNKFINFYFYGKCKFVICGLK